MREVLHLFSALPLPLQFPPQFPPHTSGPVRSQPVHASAARPQHSLIARLIFHPRTLLRAFAEDNMRILSACTTCRYANSGPVPGHGSVDLLCSNALQVRVRRGASQSRRRISANCVRRRTCGATLRGCGYVESSAIARSHFTHRQSTYRAPSPSLRRPLRRWHRGLWPTRSKTKACARSSSILTSS